MHQKQWVLRERLQLMDKTFKETLKNRYPSNHTLIDQMQNWAYALQYGKEACYSAFLLPNEQQLLKEVFPTYAIVFDGGFEQAQMQVACITKQPQDLWAPIVILRASYPSKYMTLTHRDVLGAMMNLGIKRDQFGDLYVKEHLIYIAVLEPLMDYVIQNLTQIGKAQVHFEVEHERIVMEQALDLQTYILSSMRLDNVVSSICKISREKAKKLIQQEMVKLDYVTIEDGSKICNNDCDISIRGFGRFHLMETKQTTKKGNVVVNIAKYK